MSRPWRSLADWVGRARPAPRTLAAALVASSGANAVGAALLVGAPYLIAYSATHGRLTAGSTLAVLLVVIELLAFLRSPIRFVERINSHELGLSAVTQWRRWLTRAVGAWPYSRLTRGSTGDLLERALADTDVLQDLWLRCLIPLAAAVVTAVAGDAVVWALPGHAINGPAAAGALFGCQVALVGILAARWPALARAEAAVRAGRAARAAERVALQQGAPELELLGRGTIVVERLDQLTTLVEAAERDRDEIARTLRLAVVAGPIITVVAVARAGLGGAPLAGRSDLLAALLALSVGDLLAVTLAALAVAARVTAAAERLEELRPVNAHGDAATPPRPLLAVHGLDADYDGRATLTDVSLTVAPGRRIAITGPTGSGKSTLLRLMARLEDPPGGAIELGGHDLLELDEAGLRRRVAYVGSDPTLLTGQVDRVIRAGRPVDVDVPSVLDRLGIHARSTDVWEGLSRGEALRAGLARALVGDPDVLICDEPTSGLGPAEQALVVSALSDSPASQVLATHDEALVATCDEVYELRSGRLHRRDESPTGL